MEETKGVVFNLQHYSIHDGPGIRTNVFIKGCPLHCLWCQNPESQKTYPQMMYNSEKCVGCGKCAFVCPEKAIYMDGKVTATDRDKCVNCGKCAEVCPAEARSMMGEEMTAEYAVADVFKDNLFYQTSGGGVTLSGGEPLAHPDFARAVLTLSKEKGMNTAIETCGYAKWEVLKPVIELVDTVLYDVKCMDSAQHKVCTGVGNELILENLVRISKELGKPIIARTPIVPGYNDSEENAHAMGKFLKENVPTCIEVGLLPYHRLGDSKKTQLELAPDGFHSDPPSDEQMARLRAIVASYGFTVK